MEKFKELIGQIGVFMICAQAVVHFRPKEAYGKYLRLLLGVMVLVQIFSPVYRMFYDREGESMEENIRGFQAELEGSMRDAAEESVISDLQLEGMSLKMLREIWEQTGSEEEGEPKEMEGADEAEVPEVKIKIDPVKVTE